MTSAPLRGLRRVLGRFPGLRIGAGTRPAAPDLEKEFLDLYDECREFTMTSMPRMYALYQALTYVQAAHVAGAFVECGVWKGGSAMLAALTFARHGGLDRDIALYDTFEGMPAPGPKDVDYKDRPASAIWSRLRRGEGSDWCYATADEVNGNLQKTGYPAARIQLVKGRVEETIPRAIPDQIAILRLDTDWYESTLHELTHLYPRLAKDGVLIVDDYGYWRGARTAVDEYFGRSARPILLNRIDETGRIGVKTD
jgi:O-methyltransferase